MSAFTKTSAREREREREIERERECVCEREIGISWTISDLETFKRSRL